MRLFQKKSLLKNTNFELKMSPSSRAAKPGISGIQDARQIVDYETNYMETNNKKQGYRPGFDSQSHGKGNHQYVNI